jgi:hypothetical protein
MDCRSPFELEKVIYEVREPFFIKRKEKIKDGTEVISCYSNYQGDYIGNEDFAKRIIEYQNLILLQKANPLHSRCNVGWRESTQKWYGYNENILHGFGIGSESLSIWGEPTWVATSIEEAKQMAIDFANNINEHKK